MALPDLGSYPSGGLALVNITVDDKFGDPTTGLVPDYLPNDGTWHAGSSAEECLACRIQPSTLDLNQIHDQTWHDGTSYPPTGAPPTITVHFTGSAVYVFNVLPNTLPNLTDTYAHISFSIDGEQDAATFIHTPNHSPTILYNQLVYRNATLPHGPHTLVMAAAGTTSSLILFDYLLYTTYSNDTASTTILNNASRSSSFSSTTSRSPPTSTLHGSSQSSSSNTPIGVVIGAVVGVIAALLLGVGIRAFLLHRKRARSKPARTQEEHGNRHRGPTSGTGSRYSLGSILLSVVSTRTPASPPDSLIMRSLDGTPTDNLPCPASDVSEIDTRPSFPAADMGSISTVLWTRTGQSQMPVELIRRRLEAHAAQRIAGSPGAVVSFESAPGSGPASQSRLEVTQAGSGAVGSEMVVRRLEVEIATLHGRLAAVTAQLADDSESLPAWAK